MIEPLRIEFEIECPPDHAFDVWTRRISQWWPADHTTTGETGLTIVLEPRVGGRIFERTQGVREHDWGEVTVWEPPRHLVYLWHLRREPADATEVDIRFVDAGARRTRVEIEHRGWERIPDGQRWRDANMGGWSTLLPHFVAAAAEGS